MYNVLIVCTEMDLNKPRTPGDDEEDNAINPFDSDDEDYEHKHAGRNLTSSGAPAFKDQSHRLHRSSSDATRSTNVVLLMPAVLFLINN